MSYCKKEGKDQIVFLTEEDAKTPSATPFSLPEDEDDAPGLILPNGDINWGCPCLGGMATGPCGVEFREAFSCFHYSKAEPKGSDCYDSFKIMQDCMAQYPSLYGKEEPKTAEDLEAKEVTEKDSKEPTVQSSSDNSSSSIQRDSTS